MYKLYHYAICPASRMIRIILSEVGAEYILLEEKYWDCSEKFLQINPMGSVPVLVQGNGVILNHTQLILEYIYANYNSDILYPEGNDMLETKKIHLWFHEKLQYDCTKFFIQEKFIAHFHHKCQPNANTLSLARYNLGVHLEYLAYLLESNAWISGDKMSLADITAATQISILDFLGEVCWSKIPTIKDWYCIIKSRPSFRPLLKERIVGIPTPKHYSELDF